MGIPQTQADSAPPRDWLEARGVRYLLLLALVVPALLPFNFVYRFGVNLPYWDQWELVPTLVRMQEGHLTLAELTAQHNEHRIFFPRLLMLGLAALTRYNTVAEMYFNAGLLVALGAVLLRAHVRAFGASNRALLAFLPVPWFIFSLRQSENLLWGWQLQITLCVLCGVVSLRLLEGVRGLGARWAGATAAAFVATFSFGSGIAIWPVGLVALLWQGWRERRVAWRGVLGWSVASVLACALYAWGFERPGSHPDPRSFLRTPADSVLFLLGTLGSVTADTFPTAVAFGALLLAGTAVVLLEVRRRRVEEGPTTLALGLLLFAGAAAFLVLVGRSGFGRDYGLTSRYSTFTLLGFVGLHRALLTLRETSHRSLLMGVLVCAAVTTGIWSFTSGVETGYTLRNQARQSREALLTFETRTDAELEHLYPQASTVRERAPELRRLGLSVFTPKR